MSKSKEDAQKSTATPNSTVSRMKSKSTLVRSNSVVSLKESQAVTSSTHVKRSSSVKRSASASAEHEVKIMDPEAELKFHDGLLALYNESVELSRNSQALQDQDEIMSQLLYLEDKAAEKRKFIVDLTRKFSKLRELVETKEQCDKLIPEYVEVTNKLEALSVDTKLTELFTTLDLMLSRVRAVNIEILDSDDVNGAFGEMLVTMATDLEYLKQLRQGRTDPLLEQANLVLETLSEKLERLQSLKADIARLEHLQLTRNIEASCMRRAE